MTKAKFNDWAANQTDAQLSSWRKFWLAQIEQLKHLELQYTGQPKVRAGLKARRVIYQNRAAFTAGLLVIRSKQAA